MPTVGFLALKTSSWILYRVKVNKKMRYIIILALSLFLGTDVVECRSGQQKIIIPTAAKKSSHHQLHVLRGGSDTTTTTNQISTKRAAAIGCLLALNSGVVNGACLSGILNPTKQVSTS